MSHESVGVLSYPPPPPIDPAFLYTHSRDSKGAIERIGETRAMERG